ncbi:MAG: pyridoxal-phosphate dependent enzyme, partial [Nitriliruptoraceae bacterium]
MWRFADHLPSVNPAAIVTLGEGDTALLPTAGAHMTGQAERLDLDVRIKAEYQNPTGSFKDRIASVAASIVADRGLGGVIGTSSGNGGAAMAAYGARADIPVLLFTSAGMPDGKLQQVLGHGAKVHAVDNFGDSDGRNPVATTIADLAERHGWLAFLTGANFAPESMRGAETIAFELREQWPAADVVYTPVGGGGLLASIYRGYRRTTTGADAASASMPRIVGVQPAGCPTIARAVDGDLSAYRGPMDTTVSGLQVRTLFDDEAVEAITASRGHVVEISDEQAWDAQRLLAREEGVFVEPAGATAMAGLLADLDAGRVPHGASVAVIASGAGHKDPTALARLNA